MNTTDPISYVPPQAYLYFPSEREQRGVDNQRMIFDGNTQFSHYELQHINQFRTYAMKHNYALKQIWTDNMILRFLYANNFKMDRTLHSIKDHTMWRETNLPVRVDQRLLQLVNSGLLYIHGRDHQFRPIVVFNVYMVNPKTMDLDVMLRTMTFWFEHIINDWMLPGQVENWVFIVNMKGMGISNLAVHSVRKLFAYLQENYKCRLHSLYVLNTPAAVYIPWQVVKKFLDEVTVKKIQFIKGQIPVNLFNYANREQVEVQYGGSAPNVTRYWPPTIHSNNYFTSREDVNTLVSEEKYVAMYRSGLLRNMRINESLVAPKQQPKPAEQAKPIKQMIIATPPQEDLSTEEDVDYVDDMSECITLKESKDSMKEFSASFMEDLNGHSIGVPSKDSLF